MKKTGIWLDKRAAYIISLDKEGKHKLDVVESNIEDYHIRGGSGTRFKGGPQDVVQDSRYLEREKHQFKAYFKEIIPYLRTSDKVAIFGPAEAGRKLMTELEQHHPEIVSKVDTLEKVDSMTENQMVALVKRHYKFL